MTGAGGAIVLVTKGLRTGSTVSSNAAGNVAGKQDLVVAAGKQQQAGKDSL